MKHIIPYESINESVPHNGIVLIKGKPRGKNKERMLYAGHVIGSAELKPGAIMLFLSDQFYRVISDEGRLKGIKINWRSEESLKDSLSLKSPGKISVVRNNAKTPYHWKTLKETSISQALDRVREDLGGSDYIFESTNIDADQKVYERFLKEAIDSIFGTEQKVLILSWRADVAYDLVKGSESQGTDTMDHSATINFVYTDPSLVEELKRLGESTRATLNFEISSDISYSSWYDPGDYMNPPDGETTIVGSEHRIEEITLDLFGGYARDETDSISNIKNQIEKALDGSDDLDDFLLGSSKTSKKNVDFDSYFKI